MNHKNYKIEYIEGDIDLDIYFFMEGNEVEINSALDESACDVINLLDDEDVVKIKIACKNYLDNLPKE
jgi:formylmethanofuran dehydrogenase subunit C